MSEAKNKRCIVSLREFYNKVILCEYRLLDLRSKDLFEKGHIQTAYSFPPSIKDIQRHLTDCPADKRDKVLLYGNSRLGDDCFDALVKYFEDRTEVKQILTLQVTFEEFQLIYPYLCDDGTDYVYPSQITDLIFLSSGLIASEKQVLLNLNIRYILNVTTEEPNRFESDKELNITYMVCPIEDHVCQDITEVFEPCFLFIEKAVTSNSKILVHCHQGISRSPAIVIGYLMTTKNMSYDEAYKLIKEARDIAQPNEGFVRQLKKLH